MDQPLLSSLMLRLHHSWAGHLVRDPGRCAARCLLHWRDSTWCDDEDKKPFNERVKRRIAGNPDRRSWEAALVKTHGVAWKTLAKDREAWKRLEPAFVVDTQWVLNQEFTHVPVARPRLDMYPASFVRAFDPCANGAAWRKGLRIAIMVNDDGVVDAAVRRVEGMTLMAQGLLLKALHIATTHLGLLPAGEAMILKGAKTEMEGLAGLARAASFLQNRDEWWQERLDPRPGDVVLALCAGSQGRFGTGVAVAAYLWSRDTMRPIINTVAGLPLGCETSVLAVAWLVQTLCRIRLVEGEA
jgi:hypothetical protein